MSECNHNCESCGENCASRESLLAPENAQSHVKKVIAVVSGKGGVGKSMITSLLAVLSQRKGYKTAVLDADVTGPSIPKAFGLTEKAAGEDDCIYPVKTKTGIETMSINLLLPDETSPVIWRGPVIAGAVQQFWTDVAWGDVDLMLVDCPPGTGDVPLTVFQSLPVDGIVVVTSPQDLVSMIVGKAVKMAQMMDVPVLGIVENMSYYQCPDCGKRHSIFGESHIQEVAARYGIDTIARIPIDAKLTAAADHGAVELFEGNWLDEISDVIEHLQKASAVSAIAVTHENGQVFQHFGHSKEMKIYQIDNGKVTGSQVVSTEGSGHEALADFLKSHGVATLICGGIGDGACQALGAMGIRLYAGITGSCDDAVEKLLKGTLDAKTGVTCHEEGTCGGDCEGDCGHQCSCH